ncbi:class I SAM-dependent methyltransferase [Acinetobacter sp. MB5]|uniref:class I SAM-dependent methyltransferase n=1 Tax=Acinetobacter sp. MB5 TaxID=2069438 RepID=UPI000DD0ED1C|nr:methyltransferase domain-containing protein [Acinetobacter sp. MB5]
MQTTINEAIQTHYHQTHQDLSEVILAALEKSGKDLSCLTPEDLAPIDEFHIRGRIATLELARAAGLDATKYVLDVGSGVGGTSRCLAKEFGCHVTGIDLTNEYCKAAKTLTAKTDLLNLVDFQQADATKLPFDDQTFDVVWTEHAAMNISDKVQLYKEMYRILKPGGTLAIYDVLAGPLEPVIFPVPWARTADTSFLVQPTELHQLLVNAGFTITDWTDTTEAAREWFIKLADKIKKDGLPPLGFHILLGNDFQSMAQNQRRNLEEGRIVLAQVIAKK